MNNNPTIDRREASVRRKGLLIAILASLVLLALAAYRIPLFHNELDGTIVGISEVHNKTGSELIAAVQLDNGTKVLIAMPEGLLKSQSNNVKVDESRTLFGHRSYRIVTNKE